MDKEVKTLIWGTVGMLVGLFGAAFTIIVFPVISLLAAGLAGYSVAVLTYSFIAYQWPEIEALAAALIDPDGRKQ